MKARKAQNRVSEYLIKDRGLSEEILDYYEIGFIDNPLSRLDNRIVCPVKNLYGEILGYQGRALPWADKKPKYLISSGLEKSQSLYGLFESITDESIFEFACLTEGNFNVLAMKQMGLPAVCSMGTGISEYQIFLLGAFTKNIILIPDNDEVGINNMIKIKELLQKWEFNVKIIKLPKEVNDFNELILADESLLNRTIKIIKNESNYF